MNVIDRHAVTRGAAVGLVLFVVISALRVLVDRNVTDFDDSGWAPLFLVALFGAYVVAGFVGARLAGTAPWSNGMVAAIIAFAGWIPIRIAIWLVRDNGAGLFTGPDKVFTAPGILGNLVFAALFGLMGGFVASRRAVAPEVPAD